MPLGQAHDPLHCHFHLIDQRFKERVRARLGVGILDHVFDGVELRQRAERITHSAESLRWAAQDRARQFGDDDLTALTRQVDMEAGALRHWAPADEAFPPQAGPEPKPQPKTQRKAQPKPQSKTPEPPGITTSDPRQSFGYPWETSRERNPRPGPSSS